MNATRIVSILLIVGGLLGLLYGGFSYPKSHEAKVGPVAVDVKTQEHVNVPVWAGAGAVVLGVLLLLVPLRKA
ncbi:MAG TPA: hypothetical protein VGN70_03230 [Gammaproteobacteria bacterium]|jgi:hypothetical protein